MFLAIVIFSEAFLFISMMTTLKYQQQRDCTYGGCLTVAITYLALFDLALGWLGCTADWDKLYLMFLIKQNPFLGVYLSYTLIIMPHLLSSYMMLVKCLTACLNGLTTHARTHTHTCNTHLNSTFKHAFPLSFSFRFRSRIIFNYLSMGLSVCLLFSLELFEDFILALVIVCIIYLVEKARPARWQKNITKCAPPLAH